MNFFTNGCKMIELFQLFFYCIKAVKLDMKIGSMGNIKKLISRISLHTMLGYSTIRFVKISKHK